MATFKMNAGGFFLCISIFASGLLLADGLPGEYYVTQRWRDLFAGHSPANNPSFMTDENYFSTRLAISPTLRNTFYLMELGAILPVGLYQSVGFSYLSLSLSDDVQRVYYDENQDKIVTTDEYLNGNQNMFMLSYAINPVGRLSIGANLNFFHKANFGTSVSGLDVDLALSYRLLQHQLLGSHTLGVNFQNLLSPDLSFESFHNEAANLKLSWLAKFWESHIQGGVDFDIKDLLSQKEQFTKNLLQGENAAKKIEYDINARVGFWILSMLNAYVQFGSDYWGLVFGFNIPTMNVGRDFQVAYQYMSLVDDIDLTSSHTFYFRGDFGKHREEIYARKMAKIASLGPNVLYNEARTLYAQGKYWEAFFTFGKICTDYADFFKNDWVQLHLALCQEHLDMKEKAAENFIKTKNLFPRSETAYHADLGLLRINYRDGNSNGVANQFARLNTAESPDSLKYHAFYYMGLQHLKEGQFKKAVSLFDLIPPSHPEYAFGRFSSAIAHASTNNMNEAVLALHDATEYTPATAAQQEIINKAHTLLGYIFFEGVGGMEPSLSQAVLTLRRVPPTSYYYEDAQLGLAWTALRASNWPDCVKACDEIIRVSAKIPLQCEAMLLKAYSAMINKNYQNAVDILTIAFEKISRAQPPSETEINSATEKFYEDRDAYYTLATAMNELAFAGHSSFVARQIDSLHAPQTGLYKKLSGYYTFCDEFARLSFFSKNFTVLRNDIEYALAKASKMAGMGRAIQIQEKAGEEIEKIDDQIEKYKNELNKLKEEE